MDLASVLLLSSPLLAYAFVWALEWVEKKWFPPLTEEEIFEMNVEAEMANIARVEELRRQFDEAEERRQAITAEAKRRLSQS